MPPTSTQQDELRGNSLLHQLRDGWSPLPNRVVLSLVLAGLRVRLSRSIVTMITVVLAIAFLTYTGLSGKLTYNLARLATELSETPTIPSNEVRAIQATLGEWDPAVGLDADPRSWLGIWVPETAKSLQGNLDAATSEAPRVRFGQMLELRQWLDNRSTAGPAPEFAVEFYRGEATRLLNGFRNPSVWSDSQLAQAEFLVERLALQPGTAAAAQVFADQLKAEERKRSGVELLTMLRRAGINVEATLDGQTADTWVIVMALLLCTVGIANAMLMSVTERFREIGTMKCLGAQDGLVVKLFLLESAFLGVAGALLGIGLGILVALVAGGLQFGGYVWPAFPLVEGLGVMISALLAGIFLAVVGTLYPAVLAARMRPVDALRIDE